MMMFVPDEYVRGHAYNQHAGGRSLVMEGWRDGGGGVAKEPERWDAGGYIRQVTRLSAVSSTHNGE
jgi:hypothetical protein